MTYMDVGADDDLQEALMAHATDHEVFEPGELVFKQEANVTACSS